LRYRQDWHIHTKYSHDSKTEPYKIVSKAVEKGLTLIAITDHDTIKGGVEVEKIVKEKKLNLEVIVGVEVKTYRGEITGLYLKKEIKSKRLFDAIKEIKAQGGKILIAHPFGSIRVTHRKYKIEEIAPFADFIEVYNGRSFFQFFYRKRLKKIVTKYRLIPVRGSDAHFSFEIGNIGNWFNFYGPFGFFLTGIKKILDFLGSFLFFVRLKEPDYTD
jgi:hypothetical protein